MTNPIHLLIVTPAYDGKVNVPYAISLLQTASLLESKGIRVSMRIEPNGSLLVATRNRLTEAFWQSDATHMLCVDNDLGWPAEAVLAMLNADKEFVAGVYPSRKEKGFTFRPLYDENNCLIAEKHLIKVEAVPAGFMLLKKEAIQKMRDAHPHLYYEPKDPKNLTEKTYMLFNTEIIDGEFWGEDYVFCKRAEAAGIDIWVDPLIQFDHAGNIGMLIEALVPKQIETQNQQLEENV